MNNRWIISKNREKENPSRNLEGLNVSTIQIFQEDSS